jgi:integrase
MTPLTAAAARSLTPPGGKSEAFLWDRTVRGFGARAQVTGRGVGRTWIVQTRIDGRTKRVRIGDVAVLSIQEAREIARTRLAQLQIGDDPVAARRQRRAAAAVTVGKVVEQWQEAEAASWAERTRICRRTWIGHLKPLWDAPVAGLSPLAIDHLSAEIRATRGAVTANRTVQTLRAALKWACRKRLVDGNPAAVATVTAEPPRERALGLEEVRAVWRAAGDGLHGDLVRLLLLTGCRAREVGGLLAPEVDLGKGLITLAADRTKQRRPHVVPLGPLGVASARRLLPALERKPFGSWSWLKGGLDARLAEAGHTLEAWVLHDLRRSLATRWAEDLGAEPHVVEAQLGHALPGAVARVYNRALYVDERRRLTERWEQAVAGAATLALSSLAG